ncbi:MAG: hypothetical protein ACRERC_26250 [Candidatus Binatia bacterium]
MRSASVVGLLAAALGLGGLAGCGAAQPAHPPVPMRILAVLPFTLAPDDAPGGGPRTPPASEAGTAVTAQVYRVLAEQTDFRVIPDLAVVDIMTTPAVRDAGDVVARAGALGREVGADGVIFGRVFRFQRRIGTALGVTQPASVSFEMGLVSVADGEVIFRGRFDETQEALATNFFDWWIFWSAGPRWLSAGELAGLGVERLYPAMVAPVRIDD